MPPQIRGVQLALFADDSCLYAADHKDGFLLENFSSVSAQWRPGVSPEISKLIRITLRGTTSLVVLEALSPTSY
jgi:hypothetical protein